ncbi:MAG: prefoldin subunit alpha [Candidatus Aenigmarchaeota archaeon]|nr:prefoldin subunit alpha [Candidatus Aenigmarchaeota archaeon]
MPKPHKESESKDYQEELQQKYVQLQIMKQQAQSFFEEKQKLDNHLSEMATTLDALKKLTDTKLNEDMWPSIGSGAFVKGKLADNENVLVSVGAGVVVKKDTKSAISVMESRVMDIQKVNEELMGELNKLVESIQQLEPHVEKLAEKLHKEGKI